MKNKDGFRFTGIFIQFLIVVPIIILVNFLLYLLFRGFLTNNQTYLLIDFFRNLTLISYDFLNQIPAIVIAGLVALMTIFFTIISLSFNLNSKIPDKIIKKYIIQDWKVGSYLSMLAGFLIVDLGIALFDFYNIFWSYVFISNLMLAIIITILFFAWFISITNKKNILGLLEKRIRNKHLSRKNSNSNFINIADVSYESAGDYMLLKSNKFDPKKIPTNTPGIISSRTIPIMLMHDHKEGLQHYHFSPVSGLVKIDRDKIEELFAENIDIINYVLIPKNKIYASQRGLLSKFCFYTEDENKIKELINRLSKSIEIVEVDEIEEISDWVLFLEHSRNINPKEIEDDFEFLESVLIQMIKNDKRHLLKLIFDTLQENFSDESRNNEKILEQSIKLIYSLRRYYIKDTTLISFIQERFKSIIIRYSATLDNKYSTRYASGILYLSEFTRYDFMKGFEKETDFKKIDEYGKVMKDNLELSFSILRNTINLYFREEKYYSVYLKEHMQQFISSLQFYSEDPYHYDRNYYDLDKDKKKIIDKKCEIIRQLKEDRRTRITNSAFQLLYLTENKKISSNLKTLIFDFLSFGDVYTEIDPAPSWVMREELHPEGAFAVPRFPKEKYIMLYLIHQQVKKEQLPQPKWEFNKIHLAEELKKEAEKIMYVDVQKWLDLDENRFDEIKNELIETFTNAIGKCQQDEQNQIVQANLDTDLIEEFEAKIEENFKDRATLRKLFEKHDNYEKKLDKKPKKDPDKSFGFFFVFEKSYFIKNPPVSWARTLESDYGIALARNENIQILKDILSSKRTSKLKKSVEETIIKDINGFKDKRNLIIVIDDSQENELTKCNAFTHKYHIQTSLNEEQKQISFFGYYNFNDIQIPVYNFKINALMVIDVKSIAKLVQYSPFGKTKKELYVAVEKLDEKDVKKLKNVEYPETKVKIRILEKFRLENIDKKAFKAHKMAEGKGHNDIPKK